jgi:pimeloyl-ACP methyl ester carboxylesterase
MSVEVRNIEPAHGGSFEIEVRRPERPSPHLPLVLVPGVGGPRGTFHHQVTAFAQDREVVATNLNAAQAPATEPVDSAAHDVLAVLDVLGLGRVDILGSSFGSCAIARLAELAPQRIHRQVWVAPPVVHHAPWRAAFGPGWLVGGALMKYTPPSYRGEMVRVLAQRRVYSPEPDLTEEELHLLASRVSDTQLAPFFRRLSGLRDWDWRRMPTPAARPALVIQGEKEHAVTPLDVRRAWERLTGRPIVVIEGTHMPYLSYPEQFNKAVRDFLDEPEA